MLKWAINNPNRLSQVNNLSEDDRPGNEGTSRRQKGHRLSSTLQHPPNRNRNVVRRKSSITEKPNIQRRILNRDKENNLTSTPIPLHRQSLSPLRKYGSLRDLSNIVTTTDILSTPVQMPKNFIAGSTIGKNNPLQYAKTLPTFDAEYSPCSLIPGPVLALRGIGIADSYFEKPRYLSDEIQRNQSKRLKMNPPIPVPYDFQKVDFAVPRAQRVECKLAAQPINVDESLSSSRMSDTTLDRMIDAILESARKERRLPKVKQQSNPVMSPTYTPAEDPASDLNEIWDKKSHFNEREIRTPDSLENTLRNKIIEIPEDPLISCQLRRQRAVRRKRKHTSVCLQANQSVVNTPMENMLTNNSLFRKSFDELIDMDTPEGYNNLSPDSGRNSSSDLEESGADTNNCTRRKLSFSPNSPGAKFQDEFKVG